MGQGPTTAAADDESTREGHVTCAHNDQVCTVIRKSSTNTEDYNNNPVEGKQKQFVLRFTVYRYIQYV